MTTEGGSLRSNETTQQGYLVFTFRNGTTAGATSTSPFPSETVTTSLPSPSDNAHNADTRIVVLLVLFFIGLVGNALALLWIYNNRKRKSRINRIVLGLATADFCVCIFTMLVSVVYELQAYRWYAGNVGCKTIMALQTASLMASSFMLVVMALDRHQAIRSPLKEGFGVRRMIVLVWVLALLLSIPQLFVWNLQDRGFLTCRTNLNDTPHWRLVYITFGGLVTFLIPFGIITVAYIRLSKKIWDKARDTSRKPRSTSKKGKMHLQSTGSSSLNRAKIKTLKMSIVIIVMFILFGLPYFAVEMIRSYNLASGTINAEIYGILGIFAVSNSAVNPYVFLWFNKRTKCRTMLHLGRRPSEAATKKGRRPGSHGTSTSSFLPDDTTRTTAYPRACSNNHDLRTNHGSNFNEIRMDAIQEVPLIHTAARCDCNSNV